MWKGNQHHGAHMSLRKSMIQFLVGMQGLFKPKILSSQS